MAFDAKQASFVFLILLVSISSIYEWARTDEFLSEEVGTNVILGFETATLTQELRTMNLSANNIVSPTQQTDLFNFIGSLVAFYGSIFGIFMKFAFGWAGLIDAIFASVGLGNLSIVFMGPIFVFEIIAAYFVLKDLTNTVRGVSG